MALFRMVVPQHSHHDWLKLVFNSIDNHAHQIQAYNIEIVND